MLQDTQDGTWASSTILALSLACEWRTWVPANSPIPCRSESWRILALAIRACGQHWLICSVRRWHPLDGVSINFAHLCRSCVRAKLTCAHCTHLAVRHRSVLRSVLVVPGPSPNPCGELECDIPEPWAFAQSAQSVLDITKVLLSGRQASTLLDEGLDGDLHVVLRLGRGLILKLVRRKLGNGFLDC